MQIRYQITFEDYLDACGSHFARQFKAQLAKGRRTRRSLHIFIMVELVLVALALGLLALVRWKVGGQLGWVLQTRILLTQLAMTTLTLLPVASLLVLFMTLAFAQKRPRSAVRMMFLAGLGCVVVGAIAFWLVESRRRMFLAAGAPAPFDSPFNFANLVSWGIVLFLWIALIQALATNWKKNWQRLANQHRPKTANISADGICIGDQESRSQYHWDAIAKVVDTPSLLLIYLDELIFHIVPKRAFADAGQIDALWRYAGEKGEGARQGFAVASVAAIAVQVGEEPRP
jgi:hypothetical protein